MPSLENIFWSVITALMVFLGLVASYLMGGDHVLSLYNAIKVAF